ncbi:fluoride efflux transporter FluC [Allohahella sp. A8]|uniref:fluoride efflux transporter FluC n=1 Tax=Allohahella sp. A8 TaxID=3141461 RepID=UPI000C0923B8|nr:fluoride efflux transporter CrcB [Hahellaceae bacterium]
MNFSLLLAVATGGALGAVARYAGGSYIIGRFGPNWPLPTFTINVLGSALMGVCLAVLLAWTTARTGASMSPASVSTSPSGIWLNPEQFRAFVMIGFLGAFTTFSTFSMEVVNLLEAGRVAIALFYAGGSLVFGCLAFAGGYMFTRLLVQSFTQA